VACYRVIFTFTFTQRLVEEHGSHVLRDGSLQSYVRILADFIGVDCTSHCMDVVLILDVQAPVISDGPS
jgi:hypothetical protein